MSLKAQEVKDVMTAIERGDNSAKTRLAWLMLSGYGGAEVDVERAIKILEERVKEKDAEAMWMLGVCDEFGLGTEQDVEQAELLYCQSRDGRNEIGMNLVWNGENHKRGSGYLRIRRLQRHA